MKDAFDTTLMAVLSDKNMMILVESGLALNDSAGYLAFLSECSHSCGGGIQYLNPICDNISSTPCDENKTEIRPCNTHPCPGKYFKTF